MGPHCYLILVRLFRSLGLEYHPWPPRMTGTLSQNQLTRAEGGLDIGGFVNSRGYHVYPFLVHIRLFHLPWLLGSWVAAQEKLDLEKGAAPSQFFDTIFSREASVVSLRTIKHLQLVHLPVGN